MDQETLPHTSKKAHYGVLQVPLILQGARMVSRERFLNDQMRSFLEQGWTVNRVPDLEKGDVIFCPED